MKNTLLIFGLLWALGASGQIYIDSYRFGAAPSANLLLDDYPNAAVAYSLRKLRTGYTGNCIVVRRSSNNDTLAIGFSGNYLDTAALKTFCSGTDCFVRRWYDQSTNTKDAIQTTSNKQPQIIASGALITASGHPILNVPNKLGLIEMANTLAGNSTAWIFGAGNTSQATPNTSGQILLGVVSVSNFMLAARDNDSGGINLGYSTSAVYRNTTLLSLSTRDNVYEDFKNNSIFSIAANTSNNTVGYEIGYTPSDGFSMWSLHELVIYHSNESSNRSNIESNLNNFYSIY